MSGKIGYLNDERQVCADLIPWYDYAKMFDWVAITL